MSAARVLRAIAVVLPLAAACSNAPPRQPDPPDVVVKASDTACTVASSTFTSGPLTLSVSNSGSRPVDVAVYGAGDRVVGEVDAIGPSASKRLTVSLKAGAYDIVCGAAGSAGAASGLRTPILVQAPSGAPPSTSPAQNAAVANYRHYVQGQAELLVQRLAPFADAVRARNIPRARALYTAARQPYQRIEPVVAAMGDLASSMDARIDQVENGQEWTGFHRLEHDLFRTSDITYDTRVADELQADAAKIVAQVPRIDLGADQVAAAARTLLQDAYSVQAEGEEELYSHLDVTDIAAATEGALAAYKTLRPIAEQTKPELVTEINEAFGQLQQDLSAYGTGSDYASYDALSSEQVRTLRGHLAEVITPLAQLSKLIAKA
jgi:iron uptake system component EfeO